MWSQVRSKISYHAVYDHNILEALRFAHLHNFSGIQIAVESPHLNINQLKEAEISRIKAYCEQNGLTITLHGPDDVTSLFVEDSSLQHGIMQYYRDLFTIASDLNVRMITIHLGRMTTFPTDTLPEIRYPPKDVKLYAAILQNNLTQLIGLAKGRFMLCVENYQLDNCILDILTPFLLNQSLFLCWDLPKMYSKSGVIDIELENYFITHLQSVKQVHLHDQNAHGRSHRVIGNGRIDFVRYFRLFQKTDIEDFCIEVRPQNQALVSRDNLKELLQAELES